MGQDCCDIKVTELDKGYRIEITGEDVKEKCKTIVENCCTGETPWAEMMKSCMPSCC